MSHKLITPIEMMLDGLTWVAVPPNKDALDNDGLPYVTHEGVLDLFGIKMRCFRLSNGQAVIDAESMEQLLGILN